MCTVACTMGLLLGLLPGLHELAQELASSALVNSVHLAARLFIGCSHTTHTNHSLNESHPGGRNPDPNQATTKCDIPLY